MKQQTTTQWQLLIAIGVLALIFAGCGGNGGGTTAMEPPAPPEPMAIDLSMLLEGYTDIEAGTFTVEPGMSVDRGHATFTCAEGGADCVITVDEDGMATSTGGTVTATASQLAMDAKDMADQAMQVEGLRDMLATAKMELEGVAADDLQGQVDAITAIVALKQQIYDLTQSEEDEMALAEGNEMLAAAQMRLDDYTMQVTDLRNEIADAKLALAELAADDHTRRVAQLTAIRDLKQRLYDLTKDEEDKAALDMANNDLEKAQQAKRIADLQKDLDNIQNPMEDAMAVAERAMIMKGTQGEETAAPDMRTPTQFADNYTTKLGVADGATALENAPTLAATGTSVQGFTGYGGMKTDDDDNTDRVMLYTNRKSPDRRYNQWYTKSNREATGGDTTYAGIASIDENGVITFATDANLTIAFAALFGDQKLGTATTTFKGSKKGTFHGVSGTFTCGTQAGCSSTYAQGTGHPLRITGTVKFRPDDDGSTVTNVVSDTNYLSFGYWIRTPDDGKPTINVFAFGGSQLGTANANYLSNLGGTSSPMEGKATYRGPAAGKYALTAYNQNMQRTVTTESGDFTATANLTAYFGGDSVANKDAFSVEGTIGNFQGGNIPSTWKVDLEQTQFGGQDEDTPGTWVSYTGIRGGDTTGDGTWNADFYNAMEGETGLTDDKAPMGLAGTFDAELSNGSVIGAFGATKQQ